MHADRYARHIRWRDACLRHGLHVWYSCLLTPAETILLRERVLRYREENGVSSLLAREASEESSWDKTYSDKLESISFLLALSPENEWITLASLTNRELDLASEILAARTEGLPRGDLPRLVSQ